MPDAADLVNWCKGLALVLGLAIAALAIEIVALYATFKLTDRRFKRGSRKQVSA